MFRAVFLIAAATLVIAATSAYASGGDHACTMSMASTRTTIEAQVANAADFCEFVSQGLAGDVFHAPVVVTPGRLWHDTGSTVSCRLRYGHTASRLTIRNASVACRWFSRPSTGWHTETPSEVPL
jgi:hypothetical protein